MKNKKIKKKPRVPKELIKIVVVSFFLLFIGIIVFRRSEYQIAISVIIATIPYGYIMLDFLDEKRFSKFGNFSLFISFLVRFILGTFIGIAASVVVIAKYLLQDIQE